MLVLYRSPELTDLQILKFQRFLRVDCFNVFVLILFSRPGYFDFRKKAF